jgi:PIN like domain
VFPSLRVADHDFRFFTDRGLGSRILPEKLREAGWQITTMDERYGVIASQDLDDPDWIRDATGMGEILLCKDLEIARNPLEAEAISMSGARVFALANAKITMDQGAAWYLANEERIVRMLLHRDGPFLVAVHADKIVNRKIKYPTELPPVASRERSEN